MLCLPPNRFQLTKMQFTSRMSGPFTDEQGQSKIAINNVELIDDRYTLQNKPAQGQTVYIESLDTEGGFNRWIWGNSTRDGAVNWELRCLRHGLVHSDRDICIAFTQARLMLILEPTQKERRRAEWKSLQAELRKT